MSSQLGEPWATYRQYFIDHLMDPADVGSGESLQITTAAEPALWDDPDYGTWLGWEQVSNTIPLWGESYRRSVGNRVTDAYWQFLLNVDPPYGGAGRAMDEFNQTRVRLGRAHEAHQTTIEEGAGTSAFAAKGGQREMEASYRDSLGSMALHVSALTKDLLRQARVAGSESLVLAEALQAYNNPAYQTQLVDAHGGRGMYRRWKLNPELSTFVADAKAGKARQLDVRFTIPSSSPARSGARSLASTSTRLNLMSSGFLRAGPPSREPRRMAPLAPLAIAGATVKDVEEPEEYGFHFQAVGFAGISLEPLLWFDPRTVHRFSGGPFLPTGPFGAGTATLWGQSGVWPYRPARVYVAYQPKLSARVDTATLSAAKAAWNRGEAVGVGPFEFCAQESHAGGVDEAVFDDDDSFTLTSKSPHAMIVAMSNILMPGTG